MTSKDLSSILGGASVLSIFAKYLKSVISGIFKIRTVVRGLLVM